MRILQREREDCYRQHVSMRLLKLQKTQDERAAAYDERRQKRDDKSFLDDFSGHSAPERRGHPPGSLSLIHI